MELLNYISSYIGKYKIKDLIKIYPHLESKLIAIRVSNEEDIYTISNEFNKYYVKVRNIMPIYFHDNMCVTIAYINETVIISNDYEEWYKYSGYEIIELEDIIWSY